MSSSKPDISTFSAEEVAHFAHDMRNLLSSVLGHAELLINKGDAEFAPESQMSLRALSMASSRAANLCEEMMDWARKGEQLQDSISIPEITASACTLFESQLDRTTNLSWSGEGDPKVLGCPRRFERAILNLLWNARDSIQATGRGNGNIFVSWGESAEGVWLEVRDDGTGLPDGELADWTAPFASTRESANSSRGLGLHSVARMMKDGNGWIVGQNDPNNGGARVRLEFPIAVDLQKS